MKPIFYHLVADTNGKTSISLKKVRVIEICRGLNYSSSQRTAVLHLYLRLWLSLFIDCFCRSGAYAYLFISLLILCVSMWRTSRSFVGKYARWALNSITLPCSENQVSEIQGDFLLWVLRYINYPIVGIYKKHQSKWDRKVTLFSVHGSKRGSSS